MNNSLGTVTEHNIKERDQPVSDFVKLLCARMESNPEDFYRTVRVVNNKRGVNSRWREYESLIESVKGSWNQRERKMIALCLREIRMKEAHERLMEMLVGK